MLVPLRFLEFLREQLLKSSVGIEVCEVIDCRILENFSHSFVVFIEKPKVACDKLIDVYVINNTVIAYDEYPDNIVVILQRKDDGGGVLEVRNLQE